MSILGIGGRENAPQESYAIDEALSVNEHHEVDGVEVSLTSKAPPQVRPWIRGGVEFRAGGAQEPKVAVTAFRWDVKSGCNEPFDRDVVPDLAKQTI